MTAPRSRRPPGPALLSVVWGALWGFPLGFWLLAGPLLAFHHLIPRGPGQWVAVTAALGASFAFAGAFLALFGGFVPSTIESARGRAFSHRTWAYALSIPGLLGLVYLADSVLVEWGGYGIGMPDPRILRAALFWVLLLPLAAASYRLLLRRAPAADPRALAWLLCVVGVAGGARLALASSTADGQAIATSPALERRAGTSAAAPVLLIGLDGGSWDALRPLLDRGRLPTLERLISAGRAGTMHAAWPPHWSAPAWGAIATGHSREQTGVFEDLAVQVPGLPLFQAPLMLDWRLNPLLALRRTLQNLGVLRLIAPPRALLQRPPVWERLYGAGVQTGVVRFRFTFPADGRGGIVVSDWVGKDAWELLGVSKQASAARVSPAALAPQLLEPFSGDEAATRELVRELFPMGRWPQPADAKRHPLQMLRLAADIDRRSFAAARRILAHDPNISFLAVYIGGFDTVCHSFWQYRFPQAYPEDPPADLDVRALGPVVDRYLEFFDRELGTLIGAFGAEPNVVLVSDHGLGPGRDPLWRGWHTDEGIVVVSGPDVPAGSAPLRASYLDVAPLVLELMSFHVPSDLRGSSLVRLGRPSPVVPS